MYNPKVEFMSFTEWFCIISFFCPQCGFWLTVFSLSFPSFFSLPVSRLGESRRAGEEKNPSDHLHWLPALLCSGLSYSAGEWSDWSRRWKADEQTCSPCWGHFPWDSRHQESATGTAGKDWGLCRVTTERKRIMGGQTQGWKKNI